MKQEWFSGNRIRAISDGVFAIAMTLLVLDLKVPELASPVSEQAFWSAVMGQWPNFISWIISFAILCRLWITQHVLLEQGEKKSRYFTFFNFVFLGTISFIPFPTSLISEHLEQPLSVVIFSLTYVVAWAAMIGMWRHQTLEDVKARSAGGENYAARQVLMFMPTIAVASCLLAFVDPKLGLAVWILFPWTGKRIKDRRATG